MRKLATVTSKGQVTLPAEVRRSLNLKSGDKIAFEHEASGRVYIEARRGSLADLRGLIKFDRKISADELDRWIAEARGRKSVESRKNED